MFLSEFFSCIFNDFFPFIHSFKMTDDYSTKVPTECIKLLKDCMENIETITGKKYNLYIQEFGKNQEKFYSHLDKLSGPFIVSNMLPGYEILNGSYSSLKNLEQTISSLDTSKDIQKFTNLRDFFNRNKIQRNPSDPDWRFVSFYPELRQIGLCRSDIIQKIGDLSY